jgi:hypothetical protein
MQFRIAMLIGLSLPFSLAESAPRPKEGDKPLLYLPTTVGDQRVLQVDSKGGEVIEWVKRVEKKGEMTVVYFGREQDGPALYAYGASPDGVFRISNGSFIYDPPYRLLKLPAKEGEKWESVSPAMGGAPKYVFKFTSGTEEEVEIPAGKFKAIRVEAEEETNGLVTRTTYWFAVGLGAIKIRTRYKDVERVQVMKSFTPAKK